MAGTPLGIPRIVRPGAGNATSARIDLIQDFADSAMKSKHQMQNLLRLVERHRRAYPVFRKFIMSELYVSVSVSASLSHLVAPGSHQSQSYCLVYAVTATDS